MSAKKCPKCGNPIAENDIFCRNCGAKIEKQKGLRCSNCGQPIDADNEFCGNCGAKIENIDTANTRSISQHRPTTYKIIIISVIMGIITAACCILGYALGYRFSVRNSKSDNLSENKNLGIVRWLR